MAAVLVSCSYPQDSRLMTMVVMTATLKWARSQSSDISAPLFTPAYECGSETLLGGPRSCLLYTSPSPRD
eukprot:9507603-Alexandrium_andersonii.AAC.1